MSIMLLDDQTISKIAAGEIIENPASIVKELVENSIDAGAKNITIEIKNSPTEYLRISDDGIGINEDEIEKAFLRHSTSKLTSIEDLYKIYSLGFRGEALASISNISKINLITKARNCNHAIEAIIENGKVISKNPIGMPDGTTFIIKDVFYNTPVRKKFLKNDNTEFNLIFDVVQKLALGTIGVSFTLIRDGKIILKTDKSDNFKNHIFSLLGREISMGLIENNFNSETYKIKAFFSDNKLFRSSRSHEYIYVNGRYVKNLSISKEIEKKYKSLIPLNRYPVFILYIEIDPKLIDINIHPKKHEIKLSNENNLLNILSEMLDEVLFPNRSIRKIEENEEKKNLNIFDIFKSDKKNFSKELKEDNNLIKNDVNYNSIKSLKSIYDDKVYEKEDKYESSELLKSIEQNSENSLMQRENKHKDDLFSSNTKDNIQDSFLTEKNIIDERLLNTKIAGILFDTYIALENKRDNIIFLVDQHAAHERVLYEKYKELYTREEISSQILLHPEIIELNSYEFNKVENNFKIFNSLGFSIDEFGENTLILREVPMIFGLPTYTNVIRDIINALDNNLSSNYEADLYKIMKRACVSAVKSGDKLSELEIKTLIENLIHCENPYTCPHGRPTIIEVKKNTIAKLFLRE